MRLAASAAAAVLVAAGPAYAAITDRQCAIGDVSAFGDRVHLVCTAPPQPDSVFAYSGAWGRQQYAALYIALPFFATKTSGQLADKVIAIGLVALQIGHIVTVSFDNDSTHNPPGCGTSDCQRIIAVRLLK